MSVGNFIGWLLFTIGGLLAVFSGGCGLFAIPDVISGQSPYVTFGSVSFFAGIPCVFGLGVAFLGWQLLSASKKSPRSIVQTLRDELLDK